MIRWIKIREIMSRTRCVDVGKTAWDVGLESYQQRVNSLPHHEYEPASKVQKSPLSSDVEEIVPAEEITLDD